MYNVSRPGDINQPVKWRNLTRIILWTAVSSRASYMNPISCRSVARPQGERARTEVERIIHSVIHFSPDSSQLFKNCCPSVHHFSLVSLPRLSLLQLWHRIFLSNNASLLLLTFIFLLQESNESKCLIDRNSLYYTKKVLA